MQVIAPPDGNHAPPGYYMLFVVDSNGVPSMGEFVQINVGVPLIPAVSDWGMAVALLLLVTAATLLFVRTHAPKVGP